jgi:hypothetical protein
LCTGRRNIGGHHIHLSNGQRDMWLGRCACGRDIVRPTAIAVATGATIRAAVLARGGW